MQSEQQTEIDRLSSDALPTIIISLSYISLFMGIVGFFLAFAHNQAWLGIAIYGTIASPFLYGFADIVRSLRSIARNAQHSRDLREKVARLRSIERNVQQPVERA